MNIKTWDNCTGEGINGDIKDFRCELCSNMSVYFSGKRVYLVVLNGTTE